MGYLSVWKFSYILLIFSFPMSASNHLNASVFQHFTDTGYSWALFLPSIRQHTPTCITFMSSLTSLSIFSRIPLSSSGSAGFNTFTSIACHHCRQTGILGIFLKKGLPFHKSLQTSHPGTDIVGMKTGQSSDLCHFSHLLTLVPVYFIRTKYAFSPDCHRQLLIPPYKSVRISSGVKTSPGVPSPSRTPSFKT